MPDRLREPARPPATRTIAAVATALVAASLPVFLLGALAPRLMPELGLSPAGLGSAVGIFFAAAAAAAIPGGRLTDRIGASLALRLGVAGSALWLMVIGLGVSSATSLVVVLLLAGSVLGLVDPGGARALATAVPPHRQGIGFGVKEASIPVASLLAGIALPALTGWRPAFVAAGIGTLAVVLLVPSARVLGPGGSPADEPAGHPTTRGPAGIPPTPRGPAGSVPGAGTNDSAVGLLAVVAGLGGGSAAATVTFLVPASVAAGASQARAGAILAIASIGAGLVRLVVGGIADRRPAATPALLASALLLGAVGVASIGRLPLPAAALLALAAGWGWTGLVFLAAVQRRPETPARAAGVVLAGLGIGGAVGPPLVGLLITARGYDTAWLSLAGVLCLAGLLAASSARSSPTGR